jgi:hypothetical protein
MNIEAPEGISMFHLDHESRVHSYENESDERGKEEEEKRNPNPSRERKPIPIRNLERNLEVI